MSRTKCSFIRASSVVKPHLRGRSCSGLSVMARQVFLRFKALMEPTVYAYADRHDSIEAIYEKLIEARDTADLAELLKEFAVQRALTTIRRN